jgi:gelsolin
MQKQKQYNLADSNIANLGSDLDKKIRQAAAQTEPAWTNAGKQVGLQIWRIEKFQVKSWPKDQYGSFYSGDSYIVLNTYIKKGGNALQWDVHFWLGKFTSQDEAGTAAYKTVELDDLLGGAPVQHREVQGHESDLFLSYFKNEIKILEGGVDSGFKHVAPEKYNPRLLHLKGKKKVRVTQVDMTHQSLNSGDVFILDAGLQVYQWNGKKAGPQEKSKGAQLSKAISDERKGQPKVHVYEEGEKDIAAEFWKLLGGQPSSIKSAEEGGDDLEAEKKMHEEKRLFRLSDASGKLEFTEVAKGKAIKRSMLDANDVFILDTGAEVFAWIGKGSSTDEKKKAMHYAQDYLTKYNRPLFIPIARVLQGGENEVFEAAFL